MMLSRGVGLGPICQSKNFFFPIVDNPLGCLNAVEQSKLNILSSPKRVNLLGWSSEMEVFIPYNRGLEFVGLMVVSPGQAGKHGFTFDRSLLNA